MFILVCTTYRNLSHIQSMPNVEKTAVGFTPVLPCVPPAKIDHEEAHAFARGAAVYLAPLFQPTNRNQTHHRLFHGSQWRVSRKGDIDNWLWLWLRLCPWGGSMMFLLQIVFFCVFEGLAKSYGIEVTTFTHGRWSFVKITLKYWFLVIRITIAICWIQW